MLLPHITNIQVDVESFSEVRLETTVGVELRLEAIMEGEYQKDIAVEITESGNTLLIAGSFQPYFESPNDKLSAHKVVAVTLLLQVPEDRFIGLYGTSGRILVKGAYRELVIVLNDGSCTLDNPEGEIRVATQSGDMYLTVESGILKASSRYGKVEIQKIPPGENRYTLESVSGDIYVSRGD
ncbi:hypothetical protein SAMN06265375_101277 [Muriicola jejuensis]|nr:hypothetical protein SAMN06265375_101277 [Muriicola jejuensis]